MKSPESKYYSRLATLFKKVATLVQEIIIIIVFSHFPTCILTYWYWEYICSQRLSIYICGTDLHDVRVIRV